MWASLSLVRNPFTVPGVPSVTIRRSVNVTVYPCSFSAPFMANRLLSCAVDLLRQEAQSVLCVPSQNGGVFVCLHWQSATCFFSVNENSTGVIPVPLCDPSQNGWFLERPH